MAGGRTREENVEVKVLACRFLLLLKRSMAENMRFCNCRPVRSSFRNMQREVRCPRQELLTCRDVTAIARQH